MIPQKINQIFLFKSIQDLDLTSIRQGGAIITGFSMIDSKNLNTLTLLSDALQMNVPLNQLPKISVNTWVSRKTLID